jgi:hypothetical protein
MRRAPAWLLAPTACAAVALLLAPAHAGSAVEPATAVLSTSDLPRGYRFDPDDSVCGPVVITGESNAPPALAGLFVQTTPQVCHRDFKRVWATASIGPASISSIAFVFADEDGARRAFAARLELAQLVVHIRPSKSANLELGDEAVLLEGPGPNNPLAAAVWRSGSVVALLATEPADSTRTRSLASTQQSLIAGGTSPPAVGDDLELELDDPSIQPPVYWLGREFTPGGALPKLSLRAAERLSEHPGEGQGSSVRLSYASAVRGTSGVRLDLFTPVRWTRFSKTRLGRLIWDSPCARKTELKLSNGRAEIYAGYSASTPLRKPCPRTPPDRVIAHVYKPGVVLYADMPFCFTCARPGPGTRPYETVAGMRAIARGLALRPRSP